jgi:hypothetical protein
MAARRFAEEAGLMGSETATPNLCGGHTETDTAVGTILGRGLGRFGSGFDEPMHSNDPQAYGDPFSRRQNEEMATLDVEKWKIRQQQVFLVV